MNVKLLNYRPLSGTYEEEWFAAVDDCISVLFEDDNYLEWLGIFGRARIVDFDAAISFSIGSSAMVISGGQGNVLDVNKRELIYSIEHVYLTGAIAVPGKDIIIVSDFQNIYAYSSEKELWRSGRIAKDGIRLVSASSEKVIGRVWGYHDGWHSFILNLDDWSVVIDP